MTREEFERLLRFRARHEQDELLVLWDRIAELARELKDVRDQLSDERSEP